MDIRTTIAALFAVLPAVCAAQASATPAPVLVMREAAQKAVLNNPEVQSRWHAFRAANEEVDVARGGFFPRADLTVGAGRESLKQPDLDTLNYTRRGYALSLSQMLFDGFATSSEVKRLGKAKLVRYYELLDASENTALEAARAYHDVMRYRYLVNLAEDNYVQHKATYEQLVRRTQSGVGRRADMEQAGSRLALAESNLTTEMANLHDVTARYLRIVGEQPPKVAAASTGLAGALPAKPEAALQKAFQQNPTLLAAVENVETAQHEIDTRRAAYMPRVDLRARTDNTTNYLGVDGDRRNNVVELVLNYNLFNGGSDLARERQYVERRNVAQDLRDKACRDIRQTLAIAYNDTQRLKEQVSYLGTQVSLLERTRDAYRDQFNVGQRTLLDLLDTENELLNARRAAVNADIDLAQAYLRTYAGMGGLLEFLGLKKLDATADGELSAQAGGSDVCGTEAPVQRVDRESLNARAMALMEENAKAGMVRGAETPLPGSPEGAVKQQVQAWAQAWARKDYAAYAGFYAPTFTPEGGLSREDWAQLRQGRLANPKVITVDVADLKVRVEGQKTAIAEFRQTYTSDVYSDITNKVLEFVRVGDKWLIQRESSVPVGKVR